MKVYAIYDEDLEKGRDIGYLFCYEKSNSYVIELCSDLNEWEAPLLFQNYVKKGIYTIPKESSLLWVRERVIPSGRQNIGLILKNANLKEYNERALLALSHGRCAQDHCYIEEISETDVPASIMLRKLQNVAECFPSEDGQIVCLFRDNTANRIDLSRMAKTEKKVSCLLNNRKLLESVKVGVDGYSIVFNDSIELHTAQLRNREWCLPVKACDFYCFIHNAIVNSAEACTLLECSRQNLSYLVKAGRLLPIIAGTKENLYTKGSLEQLKDA